MLVPGANVDGIAIALNHRKLTTSIGKGQKPITFRDEVPVVVFAEQGVTPQIRDEELVPVGGGTAHLQVHGTGIISQVPYMDTGPEPPRDNQSRQIGHVVICLDTSGSMSDTSGANDGTDKLSHVQSIIHELIENGIPKDTPVTLIAYNNRAIVPIDQNNLPVQFTTDLNNLLQVIQSQKPTGATCFPQALDLARIKILDTHNPFGVTINENPALLIFITDGEIEGNAEVYGGKEKIFPIANQIRNSNTHSIVIGVGTRYDEQFLRELTTELGPAMMVHTPHPNPRINVFGMFVPAFANDIRNEFYMSIIARGFQPNGKFFDMIPTIKNASFEANGSKTKQEPHYRMWTGYQREATGIGFVQESALGRARLELCLQPYASGDVEHRVDIPIIDFDEAAAHHEYKDRAEEALARLLSFLAQREWDLQAYQQVVRDFPGSFTQADIASVSQMLSHPRTEQDELQSRSSLDEASIGFTVRTSAGYSASVIIPKSSPPPQGEGDRDLHSGSIGPLDAPVKGGYNPVHNDANARAYDAVQSANINFRINIGDPNEATEGVQINPSSDISQKTPIHIGRKKTNDVIINDPHASRFHCIIRRQGDNFAIKDLNSENGTYVNGEDIRGKDFVPLNEGDVVKIASEAFIVRYYDQTKPIPSSPILIQKDSIVGTIKITPGALTKSRISIGREPSCDIITVDPQASRIHAYIESDGGDFYITDADSMNGTYVNSSRIGTERVPLKSGDLVSIAKVQFRIIIP